MWRERENGAGKRQLADFKRILQDLMKEISRNEGIKTAVMESRKRNWIRLES